jgi:beta-aspartyl-peptidase (threonine type)
MRILRVVVLVAIVLSTLPAATQSAAKQQKADMGAAREILRLLESQVDAWNRKDLEGYMAGYWDSPELVFFSDGVRTMGWTSTLRRYRERYQGEGREMGRLSFSGLQINMLGPREAYVVGEWRLEMSDGSEPGGLFTLILRKLPEQGWRIVHDHTSGD